MCTGTGTWGSVSHGEFVVLDLRHPRCEVSSIKAVHQVGDRVAGGWQHNGHGECTVAVGGVPPVPHRVATACPTCPLNDIVGTLWGAPIRRGERCGLRARRIESCRHEPLEIDRVDQQHHFVGIDLIDDGWDLPAGLGTHPVIDRRDGCRCLQVLGVHVRVEAVAVGIEERAEDRKAGVGPDRVGNGKPGASIEPREQVDQAAVAGVDIG